MTGGVDGLVVHGWSRFSLRGLSLVMFEKIRYASSRLSAKIPRSTRARAGFDRSPVVTSSLRVSSVDSGIPANSPRKPWYTATKPSR
ncbi:MAG TPA: hypothetical protein VHJ83_00105, partial [Micromonosporaceae bacterium]|nr:hypothetical protein [Micromonosporaceae bacterium]